VDWANERYVRIYTRETADLLAVGWQGRLVWYELLRHVDRAGVIDTGGDLGIVAEMLRVPVEIWEVGIERIRRRQGMVEITDGAIVIPNFLEAQEAKQSDKARQRESRARRRDLARASGASDEAAKAAARPDRYSAPSVDENVTIRDHKGSQDVTPGSQNLDGGSQRVTAGHSVPSLAVPCLADPEVGFAEGSPPDQVEFNLDTQTPEPDHPPGWAALSATERKLLAKHLADARHLWERQDAARLWAKPKGTRPLKATADGLLRVAKILERARTVEECEDVLRQYATEAKAKGGDTRHLNGETNWVPKNFDRALGMAANGVKPHANGEERIQTQRERRRRVWGVEDSP
jgi:hypothetical protein